MKKIKELLNNYGLFIIAILLMSLLIETCGIKSNQRKIDRQQNVFNMHIDSVLQTKIGAADFEKTIKRNKIEICRDVLYDWNTIVRTSVRPDDRIKFYDTQLDSLRTEK